MPTPGNGLHDRCRCQTIPGNPTTKPVYNLYIKGSAFCGQFMYVTVSMRLTMCCRSTREALILGGRFRTVAGPLLFPTGAQRFPRPFYKGRSQEKTHLLWLEFFLLRSPLDGTRSVLTCRAMSSVAGCSGPTVWVFSTSGFHRFFATKPVSSETNKAERRSGGDHSSIRDSWPIAFSGCPRGTRVAVRLGARGTQRLTV
jgi:hypothetical protein